MTETSDTGSSDPNLQNNARHKWYEDVLAVVFGVLFIGMGVVIYSQARLLMGGVSGISLILSYVTHYDFGVFFFLLNIPFYVLAILRIGWRFTVKTVIAVGLVSVFPYFVTDWIVIKDLNPVFAAIFGGALVGMGMLALFRHGSGIGGVSILAHFLQERGIVSAGIFLLCVDGLILFVSAFLLPLENLIYSVIGSVFLNLFIAMNHKPGRYFGK